MTPKVKYADTRRYRDVAIVEETTYFTKKSRSRFRLIRKKRNIWQAIKAFFKI